MSKLGFDGYNDLATVRLEDDPDVCPLTGNVLRDPVPSLARRPRPTSTEDADPALPPQTARALAYLLREDVLRDLILSQCAKGGELVTEELRGIGGNNFAGVAWRGKLGYLPDAARRRQRNIEERAQAAMQEELSKLIERGNSEYRAIVRDQRAAVTRKHAEALEEWLARPFAPVHTGWWHNEQAPVWRCESSNVTLEGSKWTVHVEIAFTDEEVGPAARRLLQAKQWSAPDVSVLFVGPGGIDAHRMESISNAGVTVATMRDEFWDAERIALRQSGKVIPRPV